MALNAGHAVAHARYKTRQAEDGHAEDRGKDTAPFATRRTAAPIFPIIHRVRLNEGHLSIKAVASSDCGNWTFLPSASSPFDDDPDGCDR